MSIDWYHDVRDFHRKFGCWEGERPSIPPSEVEDLRESLENEEFEELQRATLSDDLPKIADSVVDLVYVLLGRLVSYGIDPRPIWNEVHRANMRKEGGGERDDGKILKPDGWVGPDVEGLLRQQHAQGYQKPSMSEGERFLRHKIYDIMEEFRLGLSPLSAEPRILSSLRDAIGCDEKFIPRCDHCDKMLDESEVIFIDGAWTHDGCTGE